MLKPESVPNLMFCHRDKVVIHVGAPLRREPNIRVFVPQVVCPPIGSCHRSPVIPNAMDVLRIGLVDGKGVMAVISAHVLGNNHIEHQSLVSRLTLPLIQSGNHILHVIEAEVGRDVDGVVRRGIGTAHQGRCGHSQHTRYAHPPYGHTHPDCRLHCMTTAKTSPISIPYPSNTAARPKPAR